MDVKDSISVTLKTLEGKEAKDQSVKNIFSYKPIMSNILKYTVEEYRDCSLEEMMECFEGDMIQTGTALVEEDMSKNPISKSMLRKQRDNTANGFMIFRHRT